jgi:ribosomal protein L5
MPLLFHGSGKVGLGLYNQISLFQAMSIEAGMFILGAAVYVTYKVKERRKRRLKPA